MNVHALSERLTILIIIIITRIPLLNAPRGILYFLLHAVEEVSFLPALPPSSPPLPDELMTPVGRSEDDTALHTKRRGCCHALRRRLYARAEAAQAVHVEMRYAARRIDAWRDASPPLPCVVAQSPVSPAAPDAARRSAHIRHVAAARRAAVVRAPIRTEGHDAGSVKEATRGKQVARTGALAPSPAARRCPIFRVVRVAAAPRRCPRMEEMLLQRRCVLRRCREAGNNVR